MAARTLAATRVTGPVALAKAKAPHETMTHAIGRIQRAPRRIYTRPSQLGSLG